MSTDIEKKSDIQASSSERKTYHEQKYIDNTIRLRGNPEGRCRAFAKDYFRAIEPTYVRQDKDFLCI